MAAPTTLRYEALTKFAGKVELTPVQTGLRREASQYMVDLILAALGAGVLTRGAMGVGRAFRGSKLPKLPSPYAQRVQLPSIKPVEEEEEEKLGQLKTAERAPEFRSGISGRLAELIYENLLKGPGWWQGGTKARTYFGIPAVMGLGIPAAGMAALAGYKGTDAFMDWRRRSEKEKELEDIKQQYQEEIATGLKKRSDDQLLDTITAAVMPELEKQASLFDATDRGLKYTGGAITAAAILAALISGKLSYDFIRKRSEPAITEEAMRRRALQRTGGVPPIHFTAESNIPRDRHDNPSYAA